MVLDGLGFRSNLHQVRSQLLPPIKVPSDYLYLSLENKIWLQFANCITKTGLCYLTCGRIYTAMGG